MGISDMEKEARYPNVTKKRTQIKTKKIIYAVSSIIRCTFKVDFTHQNEMRLYMQYFNPDYEIWF